MIRLLYGCNIVFLLVCCSTILSLSLSLSVGYFKLILARRYVRGPREWKRERENVKNNVDMISSPIWLRRRTDTRLTSATWHIGTFVISANDLEIKLAKYYQVQTLFCTPNGGHMHRYATLPRAFYHVST